MILRNCFGFLALTTALFLLPSCTNGSEKTDFPPEPQKIETIGTIKYIQVEGGCWSIRTDDGRSLSPLSLSPEFMQDGLRVSVRTRPRPDMISKCMTGIIVEITSIEHPPATPAK
jgi:hypothetical protein